jgi:hypothetical protein
MRTELTLETEIIISCTSLRKAMYKIHKGKCFYSGRELPENKFHIDHIVPVSKGGKNCISNYVLCDPYLNSKKRDLMTDEFLKVAIAYNKLVFQDLVLKELKKTSRLVENNSFTQRCMDDVIIASFPDLTKGRSEIDMIKDCITNFVYLEEDLIGNDFYNMGDIHTDLCLSAYVECYKDNYMFFDIFFKQKRKEKENGTLIPIPIKKFSWDKWKEEKKKNGTWDENYKENMKLKKLNNKLA